MEDLRLPVHSPHLRFHDAIENNNLKLLNTICSLDCKRANEYGFPPLHLAAIYGNLEAVRIIIQRCGKKQARRVDSYGNTPLHCAVISGRLTCVTRLSQDAPETIWSVNNDLHTPLRLAEICDMENIATFLKELAAKETVSKPNYVETLSQIAMKKAQKRVGNNYSVSRKSKMKPTPQLDEPKNPLLRIYHKSISSIYDEMPPPSSSPVSYKFTPIEDSLIESKFGSRHDSIPSPTSSLRHEIHSLPISSFSAQNNSWVSDHGAVAKRVHRKKAEYLTANPSLNTQTSEIGSTRSTFTLRPGLNIAFASPSNFNGINSSKSDTWDIDSIHSHSSKAYSEPELSRHPEKHSLTSVKGIFNRPGLGTFTFFNKPNYNLHQSNQSVATSLSDSQKRPDAHGVSTSLTEDNQLSFNGRGVGGKGSLVRITKERLNAPSFDEVKSDNELIVHQDYHEADESIFTFLNAINMKEFCSLMKKEKIDLETLMQSTDSDLKALHLPLEARQRILQAIHLRKSTINHPGKLEDTFL